MLEFLKELIYIKQNKAEFKVCQFGDLPGSPVVKTLPSNAVGPGSIPGQGTRSHMPQLRVHMPQLRSPRAANQTRCNQIKKK